MSALGRVRRPTLNPAVGRRVRASEVLVREILALAGGVGSVLDHKERSWASITFAGTRHQLTIAFDGDEVAQGEAMVAELPESLLTVPGHLVADAAVISVDHRFEPPRVVVGVEVLLLEDN